MKLISNYKDYFDSILNSVFRDDEKTIYKREIFSNKKDNQLTDPYRNHFVGVSIGDFKLNIRLVHLFFCGQLYNYIIVEEKNEKTLKEKVLAFTNGTMYFNYLKSFKEFKKPKYVSWDWRNYNSEKYINNFYNYKLNNMDDLSYQNKTYSFVVDGPDSYIFNPKLTSVHFEKIKDPYSAAQDVYNYISGVLSCVCTPEPNLSNNDILIAKGFDPKTSFRKM